MNDLSVSRKTFVRRLRPPQPVAFLAGCYLLGILFFAAFRLTFVTQFHEAMANASVIDYLKSFCIGWRFDQIVVLFVLLPIMLTVFWIDLKSRLPRILTVGYLGLAFCIMAILLLADLRYFKYLHTHLNFQAVLYATEGGRTSWHLMLSEPTLMVSLLAWAVISIVGIFALLRISRFSQRFPARPSWTGQVTWFVLCLALTFLGIRGRTSLSPLDWGAAYLSDNHYLNQAALNGIYTLGRAFTEEGRDPRVVYLKESERFPFVPFSAGLDSVRAMIGTSADTWIDPEKSLTRTTHQPPAAFGFQPNVVLVLMESWSGRYTGALGAPDNLTPHFDSIAAHGILFSRFYAAGNRTNFGMPAVLCSYPAMPGRSIMSRYNANHPFVALSEILNQRGYCNLFVYGGDLVFDNMRGFLTTKKFDRTYGDDDLGLANVFAKWGIPDHIVFNEAALIADSTPRPFQMTILTLSDHEPFDLPDSSVQRFSDDAEISRIKNAQVYADFALGTFMAKMKSDPVFDSTIFVFVSDHALWGYGKMHPDPTDYHIPLLVYSPALLGDSGRVITRIGGQVDIIPTLMALLGGDFTHESWGRNLLDSALRDRGFAVTNSNTTIGLTEDGYLYTETLGRPASLFRFDDSGLVYTNVARDNPDVFARLQRRLRTYIQIADQLSIPSRQGQ